MKELFPYKSKEMKAKKQLIVLMVSLAVTAFSTYRMKYNVGRYSPERYVHAILIGLAAFLVLYMTYKTVIKRFSKNTIDQKKYARLFDLESSFVTGEVEFYFTLEEPKYIAFSILDVNMNEIKLVKEGDFKKGGHIVRFDSFELPTGGYFYCLTTDNQKTMKKMVIQHDKVTA